MANDNTLGAPTEGLGQTVTFANGGSSGVPQMQDTQLDALRVGQVGSGAARNTAQQLSISTTDHSLKTMDAIRRFGADVLNPKIEQEKQLAFVNGMHRVAAGEAVKEVVEEQPWYSKMFGDTPVVEGARAFSSFSRVQKEMMDIEAQMPELRQLSPVEFQKRLSARLSEVSENEAGTDAMMAQQFIKEMPGILKAHTKEHIGYQQQQYAEAARGAQVTAANRLSATMARYNPTAKDTDVLMGNYGDSPYADDNDLLEAKINFASAFAPVPGVPLDTHQKLTTGVVRSLLSEKNLHAFYILEDAGVIAELGDANSKSLRDYADRIEARARADMPTQLVQRLAAIKVMPSLYDTENIDEQLIEAVKSLNADYQHITGAREPLIQGNTAAELQASLYRNQINDQRKLTEAAAKSRDTSAKAVDREAAKQEAQSLAAAALLTGTAKRIDVDEREAGWDYLRSAPDPEGATVSSLFTARYTSFGIHTDERGQDALRAVAAKLVAAKDPAALEDLYLAEYLPMVQAAGGSEHVAKAYFGEYSNVFSKYHSQRKGTGYSANQIVAAGAIALADSTPLAAAKDSADQLGLKEVKSQTTSTFGADLVAPHLQEDLWRVIRGDVKNMIGSVETNVKSVLGRKKAEGLEFAGGLFWEANKENRMIDAVTKLAGDQHFTKDSDAPDAVADLLMYEAKRNGLQENSLKPIYNPRSKPGNPELILLGSTEDGQSRVITVSAKEVIDRWKSRRGSRTSRAHGN